MDAERLLAAERGTEKIVVEVKSFTPPSDMKDLEEAVGQFVLYARLLMRYYPDHKLYLAVSENIRKTVFEEEAEFPKSVLSSALSHPNNENTQNL